MSTITLPTAQAVRELLGDLLGRDVDLTVVDPPAGTALESSMFGVYVDDRLTMNAVTVADLALSAYVGAALGLVPKGGAEAALEDGQLTANLQENMAEVLNIMASLFNVGDAVHQRLYTVHAPGSLPPGDAVALAAARGRRLDLELSVAGYGAGRLSVVCA
jgi:hypothetical protein